MTNLSKVSSVGFSALVAIIGCGGESSTGAADNESALTSAAADINAVVASDDAARAEAEACFAAYKTCAADATKDAATCRTTLKSCLPARAPAAGSCSTDGGTDADDDSDEAADEAADKDDDRDESAEEAKSPDGGVRMRGTRGDGGAGHGRGDGADHGGKGGRGHSGCGRPDVSADRIGQCSTTSDANLSSGMDTTQTARAHRQCVQKAFTDRLSDLCERANKLCEASDAVPDICTQISQACTTVNP